MDGKISVSEKYREKCFGISFWLNTFHNAFTYGSYNNVIQLMAWDGSEFVFVDEMKEAHIKKIRGFDCVRIAMDNNVKIIDGFKNVNIVDNRKNHMSYGNPLVCNVGGDNYLSLKIEKNNYKVEDLISCCIKQFGDAGYKTKYEYYWNVDGDMIDSSYEKYEMNYSMMKNVMLPFNILYQAHGCRIDKYKEEDSTYVVDRYF